MKKQRFKKFIATTTALATSVAISAMTAALSALAESEIRGDVNGDGMINSIDIALLRNVISEQNVDTNTVADVNQDGVTNVADLVLLNKYVLGQIQEFPITESPFVVDSGWKLEGDYTIDFLTGPNGSVKGQITAETPFQILKQEGNAYYILLVRGFGEYEMGYVHLTIGMVEEGILLPYYG